VLGSNGMVGRAIVRNLLMKDIIPIEDQHEYDLTEVSEVRELFHKCGPTHVFLAAAKVGGIKANIKYSGDFIYGNLAIQSNVIRACFLEKAKLCFLGSSCIYPRDCPQPMRESFLGTGALEFTNRAYATAKLAGIELCQAYYKQYGLRSVVLLPTNLFGPYDRFATPEDAHVVPGIMTRMHAAKVAGEPEFRVWGSGLAQREFMHVDDFADAAVYLMQQHDLYCGDPINVGSGDETAILSLANMLKEIIGYKGSVDREWRSYSGIDGMLRKRLDLDRLTASGWTLPKRGLYNGLKQTYEWYLENVVAQTT